MTPFLIALLILNILFIGILIINSYKAKRTHRLQTAAYESIIVTLLKSQNEQQSRIEMADELRETLSVSGAHIGAEILSLQYQLLEKLSENNLLE
ncbi:MAG: hypothetical protein CFE23_04070 [Flavobacterium sp. BFFFF1]|uniref:hypothetical protein n=1 Tax=Flavobacterium sp. BFFFF1 TaxID=2015557 RepID=UPI000BC8ACA0|nr:hypothetical protein [Flavobacterium sp. BFFFF1]OYU81653.1 MAG: hypothetical protein CFE23_04070 [Flavobacterium sp. BFFFF1]